MGRKYETLADSVVAFIEEQPMFFVATAPMKEDGHVNISPKGADSLRVIDETTIIYADLTGSAAETIAHLRDNGRITIMWCSFGSRPRILRVYGQGEHLLPSHPEFAALSELFPDFKALRSIVRLRTGRIADSCGYGVPEMDLVRPRSNMAEWADRKSPAELEEYRHANNEVSIDGLPAWEG